MNDQENNTAQNMHNNNNVCTECLCVQEKESGSELDL